MVVEQKKYNVEELIDARLESVVEDSPRVDEVKLLYIRQKGLCLALNAVISGTPAEELQVFFIANAESLILEHDYAAAINLAYYQEYTRVHGQPPKYPLDEADKRKLDATVTLPDRKNFYEQATLGLMRQELAYAGNRPQNPDERNRLIDTIEREQLRELQLGNKLRSMTSGKNGSTSLQTVPAYTVRLPLVAASS